jgi:threonine/homoserine/homoserine lactone efflux protein
MSQPLLIALIAFAAVMAFTPGPNNIMVLSSGLTYGFRRTLPHIAGIAIGVSFMVAAVGLGLGALFITWPVLQTILKYAGIAYLIYLASVIAMSGAATSGQDIQAAPMTFLGAALFQWVNVKGWVMAIGIITAYSAIASFPWNIAMQAALMFVMGGAVIRGLGSLRQCAAAAVELAGRGTDVQCRHGRAAAIVALSSVDGRMMPPLTMQKRVSPCDENGLDQRRKSPAETRPHDASTLQNT